MQFFALLNGQPAFLQGFSVFGNVTAASGSTLTFRGTPTLLQSFINFSVPSLAGGDTTGGRLTWYQSGNGDVETGFLQVTQAAGFGGTFTIALNTTNSGTSSPVFQIKKNGNVLIATTTDNALGKLQVAGSITTNEVSGTGLFGYFGGTELVVGTLNATNLILRTNNTAALTISTTQTATFASTVITAASVAGQAGLRLPHGAAPTAPVNGDIWTTTAGLFVRVNGATVGPLT